MRLDRLWLSDFRNYEAAELAPAPSGLTVVQGANGEGKTNLLEAVGYLATLSSFRGAPAEALVRVGAESAVVRAEPPGFGIGVDKILERRCQVAFLFVKQFVSGGRAGGFIGSRDAQGER